MSNARFVRDFGKTRLQVEAGATIAGHYLFQGPNGEACVWDSDLAKTATQYLEPTTRGQVTIPKTAGFNFLKGGRVYWDHSAQAASWRKVNDRDFFAGVAAQDEAAAQTTVLLDLNIDPRIDIDIARDPVTMNFPIGTQAFGNSTTNGFGWPLRKGSAYHLFTTATSEAQRQDIISVDGFNPVTTNAIVEAVFRVINDGAGSAADFSLGAANGSHATDADSITQALLVHLNANDVNIYLESRDGTSTPVAATDSTIDYTEGSAVANRVEVWFDYRDPASVKVYINGVQALPASVFDVDAATAPWFLLAHLEKTSAADVYEVAVDRLTARFAEQ